MATNNAINASTNSFVSSIATGNGLSGGPINSTGTLSVANTVRSITGSVSLSSTDYSKVIQAAGSTSYSLTMPSHSAGAFIDFVCLSSSTALVQLLPGSGNIAGQTSVSIGPGDSLRLYDDGTNFQIQNLYLQPAILQAYVSTNNTISSNNTHTELVNYTVVVDNQSFFNTGTGRYTPKLPGIYAVNQNIYATGTTVVGDQFAASVAINGTTFRDVFFVVPVTSQEIDATVPSYNLSLNGSTDYISGWVYRGTTNNIVVQASASRSQLNINRVSLF